MSDYSINSLLGKRTRQEAFFEKDESYLPPPKRRRIDSAASRFIPNPSPIPPSHISNVTPPKSRTYHIIAPTPRKSLRKKPKSIFSTSLAPLETFIEDPLLNSLSKVDRRLEFETYDINGTIFLVVKQPTEKGCGEACILMAMIDLLRNHKIPSFFENHSFFQSLFMCAGTSVDVMSKKLATLNLNPQIVRRRLNRGNIDQYLDDIIELLSSSNKPIFLSIDHQKIGGHWILLKEYRNNRFLVGDPFSKKAYHVTKEELKMHIDLQIEQHFIYLK